MRKIEIGQWSIRDFVSSDRAALVRYANNPKVAQHLRDRFPSPYTEHEADAWLDYVQTHTPRTSFAIANEDTLIGGIGIELRKGVYRRSGEIGYWLGEPYWGRGIATLAVKTLTEWAFQELGLARVYAGVFESNPASARVLEKAGYVLEGRQRKSVIKNGKLLDELMYATVRAGPDR